MAKESKELVFGIDVGGGSVGLAVVNPTEQAIKGLHVRTFSRAETADKGESLNLKRRESRLTRRRLRRRAHRLLRLRRSLVREGVVPSLDAAYVSRNDSWALRADGLKRLLAPDEWAAVLIHCIKHRGFLSNRKSDRSDEEGGRLLSGVEGMAGKLEASDYETIGQMVALSPDYENQKRNKAGRYTHTLWRPLVRKELRLLFERQREFGSSHATASFEELVATLLMERRPALAGDELLKMVGRCTFEESEYRAPKACPSFERFSWLCKLGNLKIREMSRSRTLTGEELEILAELPFELTSVKWHQIRARLDIGEDAMFNLVRYPRGENPLDAEKNQLAFEAKGFHSIKKALISALGKRAYTALGLNASQLDELAWAQTVYKDDAAARDYLREKGFDEDVIEAVLLTSFDTFGNLSLMAMRKMIPHLEAGRRYDEAAIEAGYHHSNLSAGGEGATYLPKPDSDEIRNPVVYRAVNQAVRMINAAIQYYGAPTAIHIELGTDLSHTLDERREEEKRIERNRKANETDRAQYLENFGQEPRGQDYRKWRFYREQQGRCAYCQQPLDESRLPEANYVEIDHILPWSRSFDDSLVNKVLVHAGCNRNKGNRTPFEMYGSDEDSEAWRLLEAWASATVSLPRAKRDRLLRREFGKETASEFRDRHLNDTRYIARYLKKHVETHLKNGSGDGLMRAVVVSGRMTHFMRARWGLTKVRSESDLHHALDAAVVACCGRNMVQRVARWHKCKELKDYNGPVIDDGTGELLNSDEVRAAEARFPLPWPDFRHELLGRLDSNPEQYLERLPSYTEKHGPIRPVRVSRAPRIKGSGMVHQETIRSVAPHLQQENEVRRASVKVKLSELNLKKLETMSGYNDPRNAALVQSIRERLEDFGGDGKKAFADSQPPLYMPAGKKSTIRNRPIVRTVKLVESQQSGLPVRGGFASNGDMPRIDIFTDGKKYFVVPVYVKDQGELPVRAVVGGKPETEWEVMGEGHAFLFSLYRDSYIRVTLKSKVWEGYFAGFDRATGAIHLAAHDRSSEFGKDGLKRSIGIKTAVNLEKFHVDPLGRLSPVTAERRKPLPQ